MTTLIAEQEAALTQAVIDHPDDATAKLILADFLDDNDRPAEARAYRWCAENDLHPHRSEWKDLAPPVTWSFCHYSFRERYGDRSSLPEPLCPYFERCCREGKGGYLRHTFPEIMLALACALEECPCPD